MAGPDYILDLHGMSGTGPSGGSARSGDGAKADSVDRPLPAPGRTWLAMHWRCCSAYSRIYRNQEASAYEGRCPRCGKQVTVRIGSDGTNSRFFEAY